MGSKNSNGGNPTKAVLAIERAPRDQTWVSLCRELDVILGWPPAFDGVLARSFASPSNEGQRQVMAVSRSPDADQQLGSNSSETQTITPSSYAASSGASGSTSHFAWVTAPRPPE